MTIIAGCATTVLGLTDFAGKALLRCKQLMSNVPVFLTQEEAYALQQAVGRIVSSGLQMPLAEMPLPLVGRHDGDQGLQDHRDGAGAAFECDSSGDDQVPQAFVDGG